MPPHRCGCRRLPACRHNLTHARVVYRRSMKKHPIVKKPAPLVLRRESVRALANTDLVLAGAALKISVHSLNGDRNCDPGNSGLC